MSTRFLRLFLSTLVLVLISSGIQARTYHSGDKKKEKLSGDGPYILYQADGSTRVI
ncbi:metallophosphatase, partial [Bacteroides ovatus]